MKRKAPSFWFIIIMLENIIWFSSYTSPFIYWLKNPLNIWKILSKLFNKSWFACSNISFDREIWFHIFNIDNYDIYIDLKYFFYLHTINNSLVPSLIQDIHPVGAGLEYRQWLGFIYFWLNQLVYYQYQNIHNIS